MKRLFEIILLLFLIFTLTTTLAPAQQPDAAAQARDRGLPVFKADEVKMHYYQPRYVSLQTLEHTISKIYGRDIVVEGQGDERGGRIQNLFRVQDSLVIYDAPEYARKILAAIAELEQNFETAPEETEPETELAMLEYTPRFLSQASLNQGLRPFMRQIEIFSPEIGASNTAMNMNFVQDTGMVVVRDTPSQVAEIEAFLQRVDVPAPQVVITCWVIQGDDGAQPGALPKELTSNLSNLLPYSSYRQRAFGLLRTSVDSSNRISLGMAEGMNALYRLQLQPSAYDKQNGALSLANCGFDKDGMLLFSTSTTIRAGEYAVLGVAGQEPLFVVLRVTPASSAAN